MPCEKQRKKISSREHQRRGEGKRAAECGTEKKRGGKRKVGEGRK